MELFTTVMTWLNAEDEPVTLQRDGVYALLTWRDFNQPAPEPLTFRTAALLFILAIGLPALILS
ncbi:MAG: hypothetical protein GC129_00735 [Proteobacteria bacterium]|nr:hypothetical protein [Pseudomonadota bacterium]